MFSDFKSNRPRLLNRLVLHYKSVKRLKGINSRTHFENMRFSQLSSTDSLSDISNGLRSTYLMQNKSANLSNIIAHWNLSLFRDLILQAFGSNI
ncbi:DUF4372 domain-containing protein [Sphingobacterium sp. HJSM2_6]|uniref:DUF4372 domain-containing protein n=1 Tax=Sphingobacterium sp. HJSM2_6 TaxID=3366264 RepID=UPI003BD5DD75